MAIEDKQLSRERLGFTVFMSGCVHAIIVLGVGFTYLGKLESEPVLEITLAQYRSEMAPDDADFLAQENQFGSGTEDEKTAPSSPFQSDFTADRIEEVSPLPRAPRIPNETQVQDVAVVTSTSAAAEINTHREEPNLEEQQAVSDEVTPADLSLAISSLHAQLDNQRQAYASRPRKQTISSASTRSSANAQYLDNWRRRIEAVGNVNYPAAARQQRIYGNVRMLVALRPTGRIEEVRILQSSGEAVLDQAAVNIVNMAAPFDPFPDAIGAETDILEIIRTFRFHEGNRLSSY